MIHSKYIVIYSKYIVIYRCKYTQTYSKSFMYILYTGLRNSRMNPRFE